MLDIADIRRHDVVLELAFGAAKEAAKGRENVDGLVRKRAADLFRRRDVIAGFIDVIKTLLADPGGGEDAGPDGGSAPGAAAGT